MYESITTNIMVKSVEDTLDFYINKLGFVKVLSVPMEGDVFDFAIVKKDNMAIMFQEQNNLEEEYPTLKVDEIKPTFTLFITVKNVNDVYLELKDKVDIAKDPHKTFYGKDEFAIFDNNGNILTISA
ncbi:MAG: bleomycin resistance family protein [Bacilli bacterium]|jgi:uncharacterized glyoxalase superfamily protein PhnB|nr:bleomycin resistance family protein [Bacilli bacterium]